MTSISGTTATPSRQQEVNCVGSNSKSYTTTPISRKTTSATMSVENHEQESPLVGVCYDNSNTKIDGNLVSSSSVKSAPNSSNVNLNENVLSYTIVWSPLPPITWLIPFIGHTGICDSSGIASDFRGPYYVGDDGRMAFGPPTRYYRIDIQSCSISKQIWDGSIQEANDVYRGRMHNICCDNCHSHVAYALNRMPVSAAGIQKWDMVKIAILMFFRGSFLSWGAVLQQFLPFTIIVSIILLFKKL